MKRLLALLIFAATTSLAASALAQTPNSQGVGLGLGTSNFASGISLKFPKKDHAYQFVIGPWRTSGVGSLRFGSYYPGFIYFSNSIGATADFLLEQPALLDNEIVEIAWNWGGGVGVGLASNLFAGLAIHGVGGLEFNFSEAPVDVTIEYRPGVYLISNTVLINFIDFGGHVRYWF